MNILRAEVRFIDALTCVAVVCLLGIGGVIGYAIGHLEVPRLRAQVERLQAER